MKTVTQYVFGRYQCPKCGATVPFFVARTEKAPLALCPYCKQPISRATLNHKSIIVDAELHKLIKDDASLAVVLKKAKEKGYLPEPVDVNELVEVIEMSKEPVIDDTPVLAKEEDEQDEADLVVDEGGPEEEQETLDNTTDKDSDDTSSVEEEDSGGEEEVVEERKPTRRTGRVSTSALFDKPKPPCLVLEEVLTEYSLKPEFIKAMIRRCRRTGGIHPIELYYYMRNMKSGVTTDGEAQFIVEEYAAALRNEMEKAQKLGAQYPVINLTDVRVVSNKSALPPGLTNRLLELIPPNQPTGNYYNQTQAQGPVMTGQRPMQQAQVNAPRTSFSEAGLLQGIAQLIQAISPKQNTNETAQIIQAMVQMQQQLTQQQQQQMMQMIQLILQMQQNQTQALMQNLGKGLEELGKSMAESIKEISKLLDKQSKQKQVDPDLLYKAAKAEAEREYLSKMLELKAQETQALVGRLSELEKKIYEVIMQASKPAGEFQSDEAKLVATALQQAAVVGNRLVDVLDKRQPVKIIVETLPYLVQQAPQTPPKPVETTETDVLNELEKMGLVVEEPAAQAQPAVIVTGPTPKTEPPQERPSIVIVDEPSKPEPKQKTENKPVQPKKEG